MFHRRPSPICLLRPVIPFLENHTMPFLGRPTFAEEMQVLRLSQTSTSLLPPACGPLDLAVDPLLRGPVVSVVAVGAVALAAALPRNREAASREALALLHQAAPNVRLPCTCHFCACRARRGNSQCLAKSSPYAGPSAGTEVARLRKRHVWYLLVLLARMGPTRDLRGCCRGVYISSH